ncbi:MAG: class I SAM-dependent methyltransferase [Actinomycetia bacterium]|nr:class I SAM-dependent methyltransferase [Actinomycetes bacterium]
MDNIKKFTNANRLAWNEVMPKHQQANGDKWDSLFSKKGFSVLSENESKQLKNINLPGKNVAHLCCNNGIELLSLKNLRANICIGFDISEIAIQEATTRSNKLKIKCEYIETDVYDIPEGYYNFFDIVYISIGCFGWLPDLNKFFNKVNLLLKRNGRLFIHELHPFSEMLSSDDNKDADPLKIIEPYFKKEPYEENTGIDYIGKTTYKSKIQYWFIWTLSDILMNIINNKLKIIHFSEYQEDVSANHKRNQDAGIKIPLSYILIAEKE